MNYSLFVLSKLSRVLQPCPLFLTHFLPACYIIVLLLLPFSCSIDVFSLFYHILFGVDIAEIKDTANLLTYTKKKTLSNSVKIYRNIYRKNLLAIIYRLSISL